MPSPLSRSPCAVCAPEFAPTTLKIFANKVSLGFDDAESLEPTQVLRLNPDELSLGKPLALRLVRFTNVHAVHVRSPGGCLCPTIAWQRCARLRGVW